MRPINASDNLPAWSGLLWGLALLGLLLLPSDYRAGGETAHGHALMQLWFDASDGAVHHHHDPAAHASPRAAWDWLEPAVDEPARAGFQPTNDARPDVGDHQDSAPVGGVHLLVTAVVPLALAAARPIPVPAPRRAPEARVVRVPLPPPRWTPRAG